MKLDDTPRAIEVDGAGRRVAVIAATFNASIVDLLVDGAVDALHTHGVARADVEVFRVPGALEAPVAAQAALGTGRFDAVVALGAVVRGDTYHFEVVCNQSAAALGDLSLATGAVITNGILTVENEQQALDRAGGRHGNKGADAAVAALETLATVDQVRQEATSSAAEST